MSTKPRPKKEVDDLIKRIQYEALIKKLQAPKPRELWAPAELWPGEHTDLGGFLLARRKGVRNYYG